MDGVCVAEVVNSLIGAAFIGAALIFSIKINGKTAISGQFYKAILGA